jgi:hypothetical protein
MCAETKESKKTGACCNPKGFKEMFEMMGKCCAGEKNTFDCSAMMESIKKGSCSEQQADKTD